MIKKKIIVSIVGIAAIAIISGSVISSSYSTYISKDSKTNSFSTGTIDIENVETIDSKGTAFKNIESWDYTKVTPKIAKIHNKSRSPALIRVSIQPRWVNDDGTPFAGDTSIVTINYTKDTKWLDGKDGYYYYKEIVQTNADTDSIINSVSAKIPKELANRYAGKKLIIDVKSEAVIAGKAKDGKGVYTKTWDVKDDDIKGILNKLSGVTS